MRGRRAEEFGSVSDSLCVSFNRRGLSGLPLANRRRQRYCAFVLCTLILSAAYRSFVFGTEKSVNSQILAHSSNAALPTRLHRGFKIGVVLRGDEWEGKSSKEAAVRNALFSMHLVFTSSAMILLVDHDNNCHSRPAFLLDASCMSTSACVDPFYGMPTMSCIFERLLMSVPEFLDSDLVGYINSDILVFNSFMESITFLASTLDRFVMVGRRYNIVTPAPLTKRTWKALQRTHKHAELDGGYAIDYFIMTKSDFSLFQNVFPPFIIGTQRWDNALLAMAFKKSAITVVDVTHSVLVLHQGTNQIPVHGDRPAARFNEDLATHSTGYDYLYGTIDNSEVMLHELYGRFVLTPTSSHARLLRCAFVSGTLAPDAILPNSVVSWLSQVARRAPEDIIMEVQISGRMEKAILSSPAFKSFSPEAESIFVSQDPKLNYKILTTTRTSEHCHSEVIPS